MQADISTALYPAMEAWLVSASMDCARLMRGSSSSAKLVILLSRRALMESSALYGCNRPRTTVPSCICSTSAGVGGSTFRTTSAPSAWASPSTSVTPWNSSSRM